MVLKKKTTKKNVVIGVIIVVLGIPLRALLLLKYFMNGVPLRTNLQRLYLIEYEKLKNYTIEILDGKIYLNCITIGKILRYIE